MYSRPCTVLVHSRALQPLHHKHQHMYKHGALELTQLPDAVRACIWHTYTYIHTQCYHATIIVL
jgi:hypothetical protein